MTPRSPKTIGLVDSIGEKASSKSISLPGYLVTPGLFDAYLLKDGFEVAVEGLTSCACGAVNETLRFDGVSFVSQKLDALLKREPLSLLVEFSFWISTSRSPSF